MSKPTGTGVPLSQPTEQPEKLPCPRCESTNTKFCYYNNYNLSQPRYFCKSCRRYWTRGGTLRNVPVGGGTRKNNSKRPRSSSTAPSSSSSTAVVYAAVAPPQFPPCDVDLNLNEGSFTSLLTCDPTGSNNNVGFNGAGGYGVGTGFGFGFGPDVGSTWQMGNGGDGMDGGDCFGWSDLAISTAGNGLQ